MVRGRHGLCKGPLCKRPLCKRPLCKRPQRRSGCCGTVRQQPLAQAARRASNRRHVTGKETRGGVLRGGPRCLSHFRGPRRLSRLGDEAHGAPAGPRSRATPHGSRQGGSWSIETRRCPNKGTLITWLSSGRLGSHAFTRVARRVASPATRVHAWGLASPADAGSTRAIWDPSWATAAESEASKTGRATRKRLPTAPSRRHHFRASASTRARPAQAAAQDATHRRRRRRRRHVSTSATGSSPAAATPAVAPRPPASPAPRTCAGSSPADICAAVSSVPSPPPPARPFIAATASCSSNAAAAAACVTRHPASATGPARTRTPAPLKPHLPAHAAAASA